ncbi:A.superbus venom factor 1-like [Mantella aurantiaca]
MGCRALCLILLCLLTGSTYAQSCSLITSNVLRMDSEETFLVDGHGTAFKGEIIVQDFPKKQFTIAWGQISVNSGNGFLGTAKLLVPSIKLDKDPKNKQFVCVTVNSDLCKLEKVVLVSYQSGYIFIQTDKPIYTPGSQVLFRVYSMTPDLKPANKPVLLEILSPDNVIVKRDMMQQIIKGIIPFSHRLTNFASLGVWTVVARFQDNIIHNYTAHFEVKEYVLPSFEVKIKVNQTFHYITDEEFKVQIQANYLNGRPVAGMAYVLFSVTKDGEKQSLPRTLRRIPILNGEGLTALRREDIVMYFKQERNMIQWRLSVSATVIKDSGSDMVETELTDIHIVTSPYKVLFTKTSKFFKPGMPMNLMVLVTNPDGTPAQRVPVVVEPGTMRGVTLTDGTVRLSINTDLHTSLTAIIVTTADPMLPPTRQASASMTATAYQPLGGNYLHLSSSDGELKVGYNAHIHFVTKNTNTAIQNQITYFNYIILNKGRIMRTGRQERAPDQILVTLLLPITPELIPSFRLLAYYVVPNGASHEIVADSVWIDVEDTCMGTLTLSRFRNQDNIVHDPGNAMIFKVKADHKATVALVAVDRGVYVLNDKYKMSQAKVWNTVEKYDTGCTAGGGADAAGVFYDAGLALGNSFHGSTPQRSESLCQVKLKRRRRDTSFHDEDDYIEDSDISSRTEFPESWLWRIETMNEKPDANGISTKSLSVVLQESITTWEVLAVSMSEQNGICVSNPYNIQVMKSFFIDLQLPNAVVRNEQVEIKAIIYNYGNSDLKVRVEWTYNEEFCSLSTTKSKYRQFVIVKAASSLAIPYVIIPLTLGDHKVEVKAAVMFISDGVKKNLKVMPEGRRVVQILSNVLLNPEVKGRAGIQKEWIKSVDMKNVVPNSKVETTVTVVGKPTNQLMENVIDGTNLNHLITVPRGLGELNMMRMTPTVIVTHYLHSTHQWEKMGANRRTEAVQYINNGLTKQLTFRKPDASYGDKIDTPSSTWLTAYVVKVFALAQEFITIDKDILCNSVKWIIREKQKPNGLFEENHPVYHQEMVGGITIGALELNSTFTAFVLIALLESKESCSGHVDNLQTSIDKAIEYLQQQYPNIKKPYTIAITSYALARAGQLENIDKLMSACTGVRVFNGNNDFNVGLHNNHWKKTGSRHLSLEATSYGLLTLVMMKEYDKTGPVVRWLTDQKFYGQAWGSTQSTIMIFQSIAQYYLDVPFLDMDVTFTLSGKNTTFRLNNQNALNVRSVQVRGCRAKYRRQALLKDWNLCRSPENLSGIATRGSGAGPVGGTLGTSGGATPVAGAPASGALVMAAAKDMIRSSVFLWPSWRNDTAWVDIKGDFVVTAAGKGQVSFLAYSVYYALETEKEKHCNHFDLSLKVQDEPLAKRPEGTLSTVSLTICTRYLKSQDSGMSIMEVSMMTGFSVDLNDLNELKRGVDRYISNFEINKGANDQSSLVLHIDKISHTEDECLKLKLYQYFKVGLIQPASVTVYDYYSPENRCTKFYHVEENSKLLGQICIGEVCRCAEEHCFMQQQLKEVNAKSRIDSLCEAGVDYGYKTTLSEITEESNYFTYVMTITLVIKEASFQEGMLILGGDLNVPLNPGIDTSNGTSSLPYRALKTIKKDLNDLLLHDAWRFFNPTSRDYTYYSAPHDKYSRIDYFFLSQRDLPKLESTRIETRLLSDHHPISITLKLPALVYKSQSSHWRFDPSLLQDMQALLDMETDIDNYFVTNDNGEVHKVWVWEAHKAVVRGKLLAKAAQRNREKKKVLNNLFSQIASLESKHKKYLEKTTLLELEKKRKELMSLLDKGIKRRYYLSQKAFYEHSNKCGRMLARALQIRRSEMTVHTIRNAQGSLLNRTDHIAKEFEKYYGSLYNLENEGQKHTTLEVKQQLMADILSNDNIPSLPLEAARAMEAPLSQTEWDKALKQLKPGKSPGPDGLTAQYYKLFSKQLGSRFLETFNSFPQINPKPKSMLEAHIVIIPKQGKDPQQVTNYRPISLLNVDVKIYAKMLANRILPYLSSLVSPDQTGFVPGREARDNIYKAIDLHQWLTDGGDEGFMLSMDAEKAFDRVDWGYMEGVLQRVGMGPHMRAMIQALYSNPSARVRVNGHLSEAFEISNGTRQGCPLSPIIYVLTLEPFLVRLRDNPNIQGISIKDKEYKVAAFADDILLFLTKPLMSIPNLLEEISFFNKISNLKINLSKSFALNVSLKQVTVNQCSSNFPFIWKEDMIPYLGIMIPTELAKIYSSNYPQLLTILKGDMKRWEGKGLSWFGRAASVKMNVLPRILYLMQALPITIPPSFFQELRKSITNFIWAHKQPRISFNRLTKSKLNGGIGLPDMKGYYWACQLMRIVDWRFHASTKAWVNLELSITKYPLQDGPWLLQKHLPHEIRNHVLIGPLFRSLTHLNKTADIPSGPGPLTPLLNNPDFIPGMSGRLTGGQAPGKNWIAKDFFANGTFRDINQLTMDNNGSDPVQVNQKRNFISHAKCRKALNLQVGRNYMMWGITRDLWNMDSGYSYIVTKDTWIEMWPNEAECQQAKYTKMCDELFNFSVEIQLHGCHH